MRSVGVRLARWAAGPTLTVVKAAGSGHLFGGFARQSWAQDDRYRSNYESTEEDAFLFSLVNRHGASASCQHCLNESIGVVQARC